MLAQHPGLWLVAAGGEEPRLVPARGKLRRTPPVTGDWVGIDADGAIAHLFERRGTIARRAPGREAPQVLAANVDLALVLEALPDPNERRAERLVALARGGGVEPALLLTKADLDPAAAALAARLAGELRVEHALAVSALEGRGLRELPALLPAGATVALLGASGAGKSTLLNALLGSDRQATQPVRAGDGRGRHTTVTRELVELPGGALMLDMPGLREVALWEDPEPAFDDIDQLAPGCRFSDCRHDSEPGCAVRPAVDPARLAAWRKLQAEQSARGPAR